MNLYLMTARLPRAKTFVTGAGVHADADAARAAMHAETLAALTTLAPDRLERRMEIVVTALPDDAVVTLLAQLALARPDLIDRATAFVEGRDAP